MATILIIDDDVDALKILNDILTREGFEVTLISHWHETFEVINSIQPSLILLDVFLVGIDGTHICKQLKSMETTKNIPIILITASPDIARNAETSGADDYLAKPFAKDELLTKINALLTATI